MVRVRGMSATPLVSWRGAVLAVALAVILSWPMLFTSAPLVYYDTAGYLSGGERAVEYILYIAEKALGPMTNGAEEQAGAVEGTEGLRYVRSIPYSVFTYLAAQTPAGLVAATVLQTAMTLLMVFGLVTRELLARPYALALLFLLMATLTSLPWIASYAIADMLGAAVLAFALILVTTFERMSGWQKIALAAIATFAITSHYGNLPFSAALVGLALVVLGWRRRLTFSVATLAVVPVLAAVAFNLLSATIVSKSGGPSLAPKRLPVVLSRSIQDGPARWYLQDACRDKPVYAICEVFDEIPKTIPDILWKESGLKSASVEQLNRIQQQELTILWQAFLAYPLQQTWALGGNAVAQLFLSGTDEFYLTEDTKEYLPAESTTEQNAWIQAFDWILQWSLAASYGALFLGLVFTRLWRCPAVLDPVLMLVAGFAFNAAVFGGLSAPVDRYQARLAWLLPVVLGLIWIGHARGKRARVKDSLDPTAN